MQLSIWAISSIPEAKGCPVTYKREVGVVTLHILNLNAKRQWMLNATLRPF
jgi:hypothetical protein